MVYMIIIPNFERNLDKNIYYILLVTIYTQLYLYVCTRHNALTISHRIVDFDLIILKQSTIKNTLYVLRRIYHCSEEFRGWHITCHPPAKDESKLSNIVLAWYLKSKCAYL